MKEGEINICCSMSLLVYKQKSVQKELDITDYQSNMDFVGHLFGPLSQIVKH